MSKTTFDDLPDAVTDSAPPVEPEARMEYTGSEEPDYMSQPAPYGRFKNGKPRKNPPGGKAKGSAGRSRQKAATPYAEGINGIFQVAATGAIVLGQGKPAFVADAMAITEHGPNIANALEMLANERPEVAAVLDRIMQIGPYGVLIAATVPLIAQILANHNLVPAGFIGTKTSPNGQRPHSGGQEMTEAELWPNMASDGTQN